MSDQETSQGSSGSVPDQPRVLPDPAPRPHPHRAATPFGCFVALVRFRDNPFAMRHGKQGLLLSFFELLAGLFLIPRLSEYFWVTIVFACLASAVTGIYNALQGKEWIVPIIGKWFEEHLDEDRLPTATDDGRIEL
jgi:uncharacterized membrane protein